MLLQVAQRERLNVKGLIRRYVFLSFPTEIVFSILERYASKSMRRAT